MRARPAHLHTFTRPRWSADIMVHRRQGEDDDEMGRTGEARHSKGKGANTRIYVNMNKYREISRLPRYAGNRSG